MTVGLEGEAAASEEAMAERVAAQVASMSLAESTSVVGTPARSVAAEPAAAAAGASTRPRIVST